MSPGKGKRPPAEDADAAPTAKRPRGAARDASRASDDANAVASAPLVSVLMPCRNAMPWLPDCVASVLAQRGLAKRGGLELIAVDDSSTDGSREWLEACAAALAAADEKAGEDEDEDEDEDEEEDEEDDDDAHAFPPDRLAWESDKVVPTSVAAAVRARVRGNTLVVLTVAPFGRSGQGKALNLAYARARGTLVGEMESDDLRPPRAFVALARALDANPGWDGVTSRVALVGWDRPGMARWTRWMNEACADPEAMARGRFLEIPALRASGVYRRSAMRALATDAEVMMQATAAGSRGAGVVEPATGEGTRGESVDAAAATAAEIKAAAEIDEAAASPYRDLWMIDDAVADCAHATDPTYALPSRQSLRPTGWWPVDADFWHRWFALGLVVGKVPKTLYLWRQYPAQSTRTHDRCSLARLRACKVHFLLCAKSGAIARGRPIQVWGTGETLRAWASELRDALATRPACAFVDAVPAARKAADAGDATRAEELLVAAARAAVREIEYKPGAPVGTARVREEDEKTRAGLDAAGVRFSSAGGGGGGGGGRAPLRLFAFGMAKARAKVMDTFAGFDENGGDHWFVA